MGLALVAACSSPADVSDASAPASRGAEDAAGAGAVQQPTADDAGPTNPIDVPAQPNIVVFLTDDQTVHDLRVMTETLALLGEEGMTFTQSVVNLPVCCPSRATLLTGQHASNHGVLRNGGFQGGFDGFDDQEHTLPTALQDVGYDTIFVGKYLNGYGFTEANRVTPPGWTDFAAMVSPTEVVYSEPTFYDNGELVTLTEEQYVTDVMTDMVVDGISDAADADRPFFALVGYPAPHARAGLPLAQIRPNRLFQQIARRYPNIFLANPVPAPRHVGAFADEAMPDTPAFNEADVSDKPAFNRQIAKGPAQIERARSFYVKVLESLLSVDESVARIVAEVEDRGLLDETWFVFTSDNGIVLGEHRIFGAKYLPYEPGIRVPLVIRGPGVVAGSATPALVSNVDLAPTIVELAGAEPPRAFDGRSLVGLLTGADDPWARAVLIEGFEFRAASPPYTGVHTGDSAYWEWATGERELYDLVADPHQLDNLAGRPEAEALEARNAALLDELRDCAGPSCAAVGADLEPPQDPLR